MELKKEEALRAKENAEKQFAEKNFAGAKNFALKAQSVCPDLEGISQMVATFEVYIASEVKVNGETDYYSILGLLDTFWTVCTSCKVQYEYLRKYLNKRLSCKNCRGTFMAVETGTAPVNGSFPYCSWSHLHENGYGTHGFNGVTYFPTNATFYSRNGVSGYHSGHGSEYVPNVPFQWSSFPAASTGIGGPNGSAAKSADVVYHTTESINRAGEKANRPDKKRKIEGRGASRNGNDEMGSKTATEVTTANGNGNVGLNPKLSTASETVAKRPSVAPAFDARKLLIEKARTEIRKKLEEMKENVELPKRAYLGVPGHQSELHRTGSTTSITVPDPDFHDFDKDRSEECFKPKQIWAIYDEEDGMPRLYCLIREVISVKPFKVHISYLNSKTDADDLLVVKLFVSDQFLTAIPIKP
ncbi:unnamed protein product, partial [Vitis vinifera]